MAAGDGLLLPDGMIEERAIHQAAHGVQYLWNSIVGKHSDLVYVVELAVSRTLKTCPEVSHNDLGPFKKTHAFAVFKTDFVPKAREVASQEID